MKYCYSLVLMLAITNLLAAVDIYQDGIPSQFGRADDRSMTLTRTMDSFQRSESLKAPGMGIQTAVVLDQQVGDFLMASLDKGPMEGEGFRIYHQEGLIGINDERYSLHILFSLSKADEDIQNVVTNFYEDDPYWKGAVLERYRTNYVIKIWEGDGAIGHDRGDLRFSEAMILATLLGDNSQWLWGIHDGEAYLYALLTQWYKYNENTPATRGMSLPYPNDGTAIPGFLDPNNVFIPLEEKLP
ncbi:hypothetical protein [Spirochaeta cellobiosiphila]|uniref:hypothetical protein n=1 Tax=Spirochaeta cellobiosiphila TaxID=504483 RepID=UPI0012EBA830|nr:hypothetical protein [Spirochaeta cellobiosiphila]